MQKFVHQILRFLHAISYGLITPVSTHWKQPQQKLSAKHCLNLAEPLLTKWLLKLHRLIKALSKSLVLRPDNFSLYSLLTLTSLNSKAQPKKHRDNVYRKDCKNLRKRRNLLINYRKKHMKNKNFWKPNKLKPPKLWQKLKEQWEKQLKEETKQKNSLVLSKSNNKKLWARKNQSRKSLLKCNHW